MKNILPVFAAFTFLSLIACGPSTKEKEKMQRQQDSLVQDSLMKVASEAATPPVTDSTGMQADTTKK